MMWKKRFYQGGVLFAAAVAAASVSGCGNAAKDVPASEHGAEPAPDGNQDGDTSLSTSAVLALSLENKTDADVDYALVWDQPHGNADYDGELVQWIEKICKE